MLVVLVRVVFAGIIGAKLVGSINGFNMNKLGNLGKWVKIIIG